MTPRSRNHLVSAALLLIASIRALGAQTVAVSSNPALLRVSTAVAGSEPTAVTDAVTTYTVTTPPNPNTRYQVTAQLNASMPAGVTLTATFATAGTSFSSAGAIALDVTARQVVFNIRKNITATGGITYTLTATAAAGVVPLSSRTVTLTILTYP